MTRTILAFILGALLMTAAQTTAQTEDDTETTPDDPVVEALKKKKEIAELEKAIAEAEKATLDAKLPDTEGSGVEGSVTLGDGSGYFAEMLAFQALDDAAGALAVELGAPQAGREQVLVVTDDDFTKTAALWDIATTRVADADQRVQDLLTRYPADYDFTQKEAVATALVTATAILGAAADVASFFRSDLSISARDVDVGSAALVAATANRLRGQGWRPVIPAASLERTSLMTAIEELLASRRKLVARRGVLEATAQPTLVKLAEVKLQLEAAKAALDAAEKEKPPVASKIQQARDEVRRLQQEILPLSTLRSRWERVAAEIDATLTATDALVKALLEGAEGKPSPAEAVAAVDLAKKSDSVRILRLELSSQGGEIHVAKGALSTRLVYVGGVALSYLLTDAKGAIESSGLVARSGSRSVRAKDAGSLSLP